MTEGSVLDQHALNAILVESSAQMKRGLELIGQAHAGDRLESIVRDAVACFDRAGQLREQLPLDSHPVFRYDLAACFLNRAEALLLLPQPASLTAAIAAIDDGLAWLQTLPLDTDARFTRRVVVAYQNRGMALLTREPIRPEGELDLRTAIEMLTRDTIAQPDDRDALLAATCVNLASFLVRDADSVEAETLARHALDLQHAAEKDDEHAAAITLRARHVLCRKLIAGGGTAKDACDVTDLAEDALAVVAQWEQRGVATFRQLGTRFFAGAALAYAIHQPHFVEEFLDDWLDARRTSQAFVDSADVTIAARRARQWLSARR